MNEHDDHDQAEISELALWLLGAGLLVWASLSIGLVAGLLYSPMP